MAHLEGDAVEDSDCDPVADGLTDMLVETLEIAEFEALCEALELCVSLPVKEPVKLFVPVPQGVAVVLSHGDAEALPDCEAQGELEAVLQEVLLPDGEAVADAHNVTVVDELFVGDVVELWHGEDVEQGDAEPLPQPLAVLVLLLVPPPA